MRLSVSAISFVFLVIFSVPAPACTVTNTNPCSGMDLMGQRFGAGAILPKAAKVHKAVKPFKRQWVKRTKWRQVQRVARISYSSYGLIAKARAYLGRNAAQLGLPARLWCSDFMNKITGGGTGSRLARSWASAGSPASGPAPGVVAVMARGRTGGHVGIVSDVNACGPGRVMMISGNFVGRRVGEGCVSTRSVIAWRHV